MQEKKPKKEGQISLERAKEISLEVFQSIDWYKLNREARSLKLQLGITRHGDVIPTAAIFTSLPHRRTMSVGNPVTATYNDYYVKFARDSKKDLIVRIDLVNLLNNGWERASESEFRDNIYDSLLHEFSHLASNKSPLQHHTNPHNPYAPSATLRTGIAETDIYGVFDWNEERNGRMNEVLTEVATSILQFRLDPTRKRRLNAYSGFVSAFGFLIAGIKATSQQKPGELINKFLKDYFGDTPEIVSADAIKTLPESIQYAFWELLKDENDSTFYTEYNSRICQEFGITNDDMWAMLDEFQMERPPLRP
jgi:hypothetical protein